MVKNVKLEKFYDKVYKKGEEKHFTNFVTKGTDSKEANEVLKELSWKSKSILDVGCGTGLFAYKAAKAGAEKVLGIDFSEVAIKIAKKKYQQHNLQFEHLDVKNIEKKFDVIVSIGTLEHMDDPLKILKKMKKHLKNNGKMILTCPNWTNPRGYILMTLWFLFHAPVTLADLHYQTPKDFETYAKKLNMNLRWRTFDQSWAQGEVLIKDFQRRLPNVIKDAKLNVNKDNISDLIKWIKQNVVTLDNSLPHSGAIGLYVFSPRKK